MIFYPWESSDLAVLKITDWHNTRYQHIPFISLHYAVNHFPRKPNLLKYIIPVVMYRCESWTIKKAERWIDAFNCGVGRRLVTVPWTAKRSNQSILNIHWKDWCWSSNTLATWCQEWTHWKRPWCWARLKAGGEGDNRGWDGWMASPTWWTGKPGVPQSRGSQRVGHDWADVVLYPVS